MTLMWCHCLVPLLTEAWWYIVRHSVPRPATGIMRDRFSFGPGILVVFMPVKTQIVFCSHNFNPCICTTYFSKYETSQNIIIYKWINYLPGPLLLICINFNPSMDCIPYKVCDEITYPFRNYNGATDEAWEWISKFISHFVEHVITYP